MKIAIHHRKNSFSERWIEYCKKHSIEYTIVNAYSSNIMTELKECDCFMWHFHHADYRENLFAKELIQAIEMAGIRVFPNSRTSWHFDDKIAEKYIFEALKLPAVKSYVFYEKKTAYKWIEKTTFPKVFKLRGGAGASNVKLIKNVKKAKSIVDKAFSTGFKQYNSLSSWLESLRLWRNGKGTFKDIVYKFQFLFYTPRERKMLKKEKGYVLFQEFIPNNKFDIRVIVTGNRAFAIKRLVRQNDFRASGSGFILYDKNEIDERCIEMSFDANKKLKCQSVAFDYIFDQDNNPLIVEISYGYAMHGYDKCTGYWTSDMQWHEETFTPQYWQVEDILNLIN